MHQHNTKSESAESLCRRLARGGASDDEIVIALKEEYPSLSPGAIAAYRKYLQTLRDRMASPRKKKHYASRSA